MGKKEGRFGGPLRVQEGGAVELAALEGLLERATRRELRNTRCRDCDLLAGPRIDSLSLLALLGRELAEPGERNCFPTRQRIGDAVEKSVDGLRRVSLRKSTP